MLLSMTGYGAGQAEGDQVTAAVEIRTVNNRYLKLHARLPEGYASIEPRLEDVVRKQVRRGAVQLNLELRRAATADTMVVNTELISSLHRQLRALQGLLGEDRPIQLESLLALPGVIQDVADQARDAEHDWPVIKTAIQDALADLHRMREAEGAAMAKDLADQAAEIADNCDQIAGRVPDVVEAYGARLTERINKLLVDHDVQVQPADVVREVGIFAERADISEEIVRLRSHLEQFSQVMTGSDPGAGRKLEFLVQELLRETNTIGSKANDATIARHVVHIKTCIERIREMVQNVE